MIDGTYGQTINAYLTLEEKRIHTAVSKAQIQYLCKFTNDMTKTIKYVYGKKMLHTDRYVNLDFLYHETENVFTYKINFKPYGYWTYEVYEVSWLGSSTVTADTAPSTEEQVLSVSGANGVVKGRVEIGKVYINETSGSEQIKYTKHEPSTQTNYLYSN